MKELNVFIENKPGRLKAVTGILNDKKINIRTLTIQSKNEFGVIKVIVDKPDDAFQELLERGFSCSLTEIIAIQVADKLDGINEILEIFSTHNINIKDAFAFVKDPGKIVVICVEVDEVEKVKKILIKENLILPEDIDPYNL